MDQRVIVSPVVHCIILRENALYMRRIKAVIPGVPTKDAPSYWELPLGKSLRGEALTPAAVRITHRQTGLWAEHGAVLRPPSGSVAADLGRYYVKLTKVSGECTKTGFELGREGEVQWIDLALLDMYAVRTEVHKMVAVATGKKD